MTIEDFAIVLVLVALAAVPYWMAAKGLTRESTWLDLWKIIRGKR